MNKMLITEDVLNADPSLQRLYKSYRVHVYAGYSNSKLKSNQALPPYRYCENGKGPVHLNVTSSAAATMKIPPDEIPTALASYTGIIFNLCEIGLCFDKPPF